MGRFIINADIDGIDRRDIDDKKLSLEEGNTIIIVVDDNLVDEEQKIFHLYYNKVREFILSRNRVILLVVGNGDNELGKALATLMCSYSCYDIYYLDSADILTRDYIETVEERKPTYDEIQTYVGGDIAAYSDINTILIGIESLIRENDLEGLKAFLERHLPSVSKFTESIDYMKAQATVLNTGELQSLVEKLKKETKRADEVLEKTKSLLGDTTRENEQLEESLEEYKRKLDAALLKVEELEGLKQSGSTAIRTYKEINTALIRCRTKLVIYFKEVSKIPYINSMVLALMDTIKLKGHKVKLLVYDNKCGLSTVYKPLNILGSSDYMSKREAFAGQVEKLVIVEPNPTILNDILTYDNPTNDVVIVYDRMNQVNDLVKGNNVHKFFVINSSKDFKEVQNLLKITDRNSIITREGSGIGQGVLDIPFIEDYSMSTDTAKISKYMKATTSSGRPLIKHILDKVRIDALS